jgi:3-oxoacid CoA-transferase B subunit
MDSEERLGLTDELMALRAAKELEDGMYVNLGIGIPTMVSNWILDRDIILQAEIGFLEQGPFAEPDEVDQDIISAGAEPVTVLRGASFFSISESFAMIRGGHIDVAILGALQVSEKGDLASWNNPARKISDSGNIGGSMDLAVGAIKVIVIMEHTTRDGGLKILKECTYPLTAKGVVNLIITNLAVIEVSGEGLVLKEIAPGITPEQVQAVTGAELKITEDLKEMEF